MSDYSLGIDIGGTFTDLVIHDHTDGRRWGRKVLTTHAHPQRGVVAGIRAILDEAAIDPRAIGRVVHATTLFTNALIERKGAPPGVASAWGLLVAPARVDRVATVGFGLDTGNLAQFEAAFRALEDEARRVVAATGLPVEAARIERLGDGRCVGQGFDLVVSLPPGPYDDPAALQAAFAHGYREKFGRAPPEVPLEFINARVAIRIPVPGGAVAELSRGDDTGNAIKSTRRAYFTEAGGFTETTVYDRDRLLAGAVFSGPALVEDAGSTLVVGPGGRAEMMLSGSIVVTLPA
jgi:N-methylhydantoinase A